MTTGGNKNPGKPKTLSHALTCTNGKMHNVLDVNYQYNNFK